MLPDAVAALLRHWQRSDVPLAEARRRWLESQEVSVAVANLKRKADRIALCRYSVSGELLRWACGSEALGF